MTSLINDVTPLIALSSILEATNGVPTVTTKTSMESPIPDVIPSKTQNDPVDNASFNRDLILGSKTSVSPLLVLGLDYRQNQYR